MLLGNKKTLEEALFFFRTYIHDWPHNNLNEISKDLGCSRRLSYLYKHVFSILDEKSIRRIDDSKIKLNPEILAAICLSPFDLRDKLIVKIEKIHYARNPFDEIDSIIENHQAIDPLQLLSVDYWLLISKYLLDRNINSYPFTKNAIFFIQSIGHKGYQNQSSKQKKWIKGLIEADKLDPNTNYFCNEILKKYGLIKDLKIINDYIKCL